MGNDGLVHGFPSIVWARSAVFFGVEAHDLPASLGLILPCW